MGYCKKYDGYTISSCENDDVDDLCLFFDTHWRKNHVFYTDREFFDWQYYNRRRSNYNFLIARDCTSGDILGQIGFIPTYLFDYDIADCDKFIWFATWMIRQDMSRRNGLGLRLLTSVPIYENTESVGTNGYYDSALPLYRMMKFETGIHDHFYILNENARVFKIACAPQGFSQKGGGSGAKGKVTVIDQNSFMDVYSEIKQKNQSEFIKKTKTYFINRYFNHPVYKYEVMLISTGSAPKAVFFFRTSFHDDACVIRIIDGIGGFHEIENIFDDIQALLSERGAEYIDLYCVGIGRDVLENAGFTSRLTGDEIIIPNYFEPFERINRNINYAYLDRGCLNRVIFKGDGDQDRPNIHYPRGTFQRLSGL